MVLVHSDTKSGEIQEKANRLRNARFDFNSIRGIDQHRRTRHAMPPFQRDKKPGLLNNKLVALLAIAV